jgi:putative hydrolase of HD superfamily
MKILELALISGKLKRLKRTGWLRHKIDNPESVAEHSYRVALLVMFLAPKIGADVHKAIRMALLHDLGEAEIGDIVTVEGSKRLANLTEKLEKERAAMVKILSLSESTEECLALFDEYEENKTKEAQLVKQVDRLEMAIQAHEYEQEYKINLDEFFETTHSEVTDEYLTSILEDIEKLRKLK